MNQQYQEVVNELKEMYIFAERTESLEELIKLQRASLMNQAKLVLEGMENEEEAECLMKLALVNSKAISDEDILKIFISKFLSDFVKSGKEFIN